MHFGFYMFIIMFFVFLNMHIPLQYTRLSERRRPLTPLKL